MADFDIIGIGIFALIIGGILFILFARRKSKNVDEEVEHIDPPQPPPLPTSPPPVQPICGRKFTLSELKLAQDGIYSWDESGCVFEINTDGSVTVVGWFDAAELLVDPVQEMFDRLNDDGLFEMLPRMWSVHAFNNDDRENDTLVVVWNDDFLSLQTCPRSLDEVKQVTLQLSSFDGVSSVIKFMLSTILKSSGDGYMTLMPSNEKEYILSLGAKACIKRPFSDKVRVKISSPVAMGAFGIAIARTIDKPLKISFAFGYGEDYMCCDLLAENSVFEVKKILRDSIIQPLETFTALQHIARGCMTQSLILERCGVNNHLLMDMLPYTMSLLQKENGRVIKIYDCISKPIFIPTSQGDKDITIGDNQSLSFLIGSNELIDDVMAECNAPNGKVGAFIELDSNMDVTVKITSNSNDYYINVGELIG